MGISNEKEDKAKMIDISNEKEDQAEIGKICCLKNNKAEYVCQNGQCEKYAFVCVDKSC